MHTAHSEFISAVGFEAEIKLKLICDGPAVMQEQGFEHGFRDAFALLRHRHVRPQRVMDLPLSRRPAAATDGLQARRFGGALNRGCGSGQLIRGPSCGRLYWAGGLRVDSYSKLPVQSCASMFMRRSSLQCTIRPALILTRLKAGRVQQCWPGEAAWFRTCRSRPPS
jgi:hypothetical protein